ncbi:hypothetical protein FACS1894187_24700 [Synergistales bacterium]|nr:hypothetical protein FACS1894187_24700 [Synergistales bacterium]
MASNDPFVTHSGPFGYELKGVRLGMTFKSLDEALNFAVANVGYKNTLDNTVDIRVNINILQDKKSVGGFWFSMKVKGKNRHIQQVEYGGEYFIKNSSSLKEQAQMAKWTGDEFVAFVNKSPNLIVRAEGLGEFLFIKENQNLFRLIRYSFGSGKFEKELPSSPMGEDFALLLMNKYGVEDFARIDYDYFYVDEKVTT